MSHFDPTRNKRMAGQFAKTLNEGLAGREPQDYRLPRRVRRALHGYDRGRRIWVPADLVEAIAVRRGALTLNQNEPGVRWAPAPLFRFRRRLPVTVLPGEAEPVAFRGEDGMGWKAGVEGATVTLALPTGVGVALAGHLTTSG